MHNRRGSSSDDSLELLLDTISNAFGGILFLAILLTLLLHVSQPKMEVNEVAEPARLELIELAGRLEQVVAEIETLEHSLAMQEEARRRLVKPDLEASYASLQADRRQQRQLERGILEVAKQAAAVQQSLDAVAARHAQLDQALTEMAQAVADQRGQLQQERQRRSRSVVPPRSRTSAKREFSLIVRYGRVYQDYRWDGAKRTKEPNLEDFVVLGERDGHVRITPKPYKGTPITDSPEFAADVRSRLAGHPPHIWHVCLVVWEDSFQTFAELKKPLVDAGYELRILPIPHGGAVHEAHVPNPQVQ